MSNYELLKIIGEGASAVSYLARDANGQEVLVKRLQESLRLKKSKGMQIKKPFLVLAGYRVCFSVGPLQHRSCA